MARIQAPEEHNVNQDKPARKSEPGADRVLSLKSAFVIRSYHRDLN